MTASVITSIVRPRYRSAALMENLRATRGAEGDVAVLHGYHAPGDGGGGSYWWDPDSTSDHNGGDVVSAGAPRGRWIAVPNSAPLSVRDFGATGDGDTDDYATVWECIKRATNDGEHGGSVYLPRPPTAYALETPLVYVGAGGALNIIGEQGGQVVAGSALKWAGDAGTIMFDLSGAWRGVVERVDFDCDSIARSSVWYHSDQPYGGVGVQGYVWRNCGFLNANPDADDPVLFVVGDPTADAWAPTTAYDVDDLVTNGAKVYRCITAGVSAGSGGPTTTAEDIVDGSVHWRFVSAFVSYQADLTRWDHCQFHGSAAQPENVTLWRSEQGGNTCNFSFDGGAFYYGRYGIDAAQGSSVIDVHEVFFGAIHDANDGTDAAAMRFGGTVRATVRGSSCQNTPHLARFIAASNMGSTGGNGLEVAGCRTDMESPADLGVIYYGAPLILRNNYFYGAGDNLETITPRIILGLNGPLFIGIDGLGGQVPGSLVSEGNSYGYADQGSYAPFYNGFGGPLCGPASYEGDSAHFGRRRCHVYSRGDMATKTGTATPIALEPWDGSIARNLVAWTPGELAAGATVTMAHTWEVADILVDCDTFGASFSEYLPAGVLISCGRSGPEQVWVALTNTTGAPVTPAAGSVLFTARRAA